MANSENVSGQSNHTDHMDGCDALPYACSIPKVPSALGALDAAGRAEFWASLALYHTRGMGGKSCKKLVDAFGSAYEAVCQVKEWGAAGISEEKRRAFRSEEWRIPARREWDASRGLRGTVLLWTDARYPALLRDLLDAPIRLYCQGDISLLSNACIGIVGTRKCSREGVRATSGIAAGLAAAGVTVVSGMAVGIDRQAHLASVELPGGSIGVLGAGLDVDYPRQNHELRVRLSERGLLLTEYPPGTHPDPSHFPVRNRIISGLSLGVLVVEAALRSGSLITARLALEQNRTVYAIPGLCGAKEAGGCQELIRQGAQPVFSSADILSDLLPQLKGHARGAAAQVSLPVAADSRPERDSPSPAPLGTSSSVSEQGAPRLSEFPPELPSKLPPELPSEILPKILAETSDRTLPTGDASLSSRILVLLAQGEPLRIDDVCQRLDAPTGEISAALAILEVRGMVRLRADGTYIPA